MYHAILLPAQDRTLDAGPLAQALADLTLYGVPAIDPALALAQGRLNQPETRPLLAQLLKTAMGPLERDGDWAPVGSVLRALDERSAPQLEDILLPAQMGESIDPAHLPDSTVVVLAGLIDAAGRPGKALALLDSLEASRPTAHFMALSWQARCHILGASMGLDALWPGVSLVAPSARSLARHHAEQRHMEEALAGFSAALTQAMTAQARRGIGADLAVLAAWLHGHGQGALLEEHRPIAHHLAEQPGLAREALDLLLRAPASRAWEPMRESWLEAARHYFQCFVPQGHVPAPQPLDYLMRCRPAA